jgi:hypothetical protein
MKASIVLASFILFGNVNSIHAQDIIKRNMINPTAVTLINDSSLRLNGALYQVNDSSIMISHSTKVKDYKRGDFIVSDVDIIDIQIIKTLSRTKVRNGVFIGAASGFATGCLIGLLSDDSFFDNAEAVLAGGLAVMPIGVFAGAMIGSFSIKIPINGSMDSFSRNKAKLKKYALKK